jgi:rubrerythrin
MDHRLIIRDDADVARTTIAAYEETRRDLVRRGIATAGATTLASTIPALLRVRNAFAAATGDGPVLAAALAIEQVAVFAYYETLAKGALSPPVAQFVRLFRAHEQTHAQALTVDLRNLAGTTPRPPMSVADVDRTLARFKLKKGLAQLRTQSEILSFLIELEAVTIGAYYDAVSKLKDFRLLQLGAQIMANEGQHATVLRTLAHPRDTARAVPNALEQGRR